MPIIRLFVVAYACLWVNSRVCPFPSLTSLCVWCVLSVSLSELANNDAWLAWETQCRPPINFREGGRGTGTVTHPALLHPRDPLKVMQGSLSPALSISISLMIVIMPLTGINSYVIDLNYGIWYVWHYLMDTVNLTAFQCLVFSASVLCTCTYCTSV